MLMKSHFDYFNIYCNSNIIHDKWECTFLNFHFLSVQIKNHDDVENTIFTLGHLFIKLLICHTLCPYQKLVACAIWILHFAILIIF